MDTRRNKKDVFICHASEDKQAIAHPLAWALEKADISYWLDEAEICWGDSITARIQEGLRDSAFVIAILTPHSVNKSFPRRELDSALGAEATSGTVRVLPLLAGTAAELDDIRKQLPLLADKFYVSWQGDPEPVVSELRKRLGRTEGPATASRASDAPAGSVPLPAIPKQFTDLDKDRFRREAYATIRSYFAKALGQLCEQYPHLQADLEDTSQQSFVAKVYDRGAALVSCTISLGGLAQTSCITYSGGSGQTGLFGGISEAFAVSDNGTALGLEPLLGWIGGEAEASHLSPLGAAEYLWRRLIEPLGRSGREHD